MNLIETVAHTIDQRHPNLRQEPWTTRELVRLVLKTALEIHDQPATDPDLMLVRDITDEATR